MGLFAFHAIKKTKIFSMLYIIPIEPLEERYTEQWYRWFPEYCKQHGIEYAVIDGKPLTQTVEVGTFLDINSTVHYKAHQLASIARLFHNKLVKPGDVFFVADIEFWGIEIIKYLSVLNKIPVKLTGFCHAASYTREDFIAPCEPFAEYFERGWFKVFDRVYVGSQYHKQQILEHRAPKDKGTQTYVETMNKIRVTGNPYDVKGVRDEILPLVKEKRNRVIHTNRPDPEKRPEITLQVFQELYKVHPDWEYMVCTSRKQWGTGAVRELALAMQASGKLIVKEGISKQEYLTLLAESRVMTGNTIEENFGYCVLEAMIFETVPVVPNAYSHPELLHSRARCLFNSTEQQKALIEWNMVEPERVAQYADRYQDSLAAIIQDAIK